MIYETPNRATDFGEITKLLTTISLNVFFPNQNEEICSILFETKEKEYFFLEKIVFFSVSVETNDKIIECEPFIGSNDVEVFCT